MFAGLFFEADNLKRSQPAPCRCVDCKIARAVDVTPAGGRVYQITPGQYSELVALAERRQLSEEQLNSFTLRMFAKVPSMLREIEAAAIMAHLERGEFQ